LAEMNDQIIALKMKVPIKQNAATGI